MSYAPSLPAMHYHAAYWDVEALSCKGPNREICPWSSRRSSSWSSTARRLSRVLGLTLPPTRPDPGRRGDPIGGRRGVARKVERA